MFIHSLSAATGHFSIQQIKGSSLPPRNDLFNVEYMTPRRCSTPFPDESRRRMLQGLWHCQSVPALPFGHSKSEVIKIFWYNLIFFHHKKHAISSSIWFFSYTSQQNSVILFIKILKLSEFICHSILQSVCVKIILLFLFWDRGLIKLKLALTSYQSSCLSLPSSEIRGLCHRYIFTLTDSSVFPLEHTLMKYLDTSVQCLCL